LRSLNRRKRKESKISAFVDLTGQIFGKLTVVSLVSRGSRRNPKILWLCQCSCGKQKVAQGGLLRRGSIQSCGCIYQLKTPLELRFWEMVDRNGPVPAHRPELGPCWIWIGSKNNAGYGQINRGDSVPVLATRVSYEILHGPGSLGENFACHHCDNPPCVNYNHLFAGTHQENMKDMTAKGRQTRGDYPTEQADR
jgi:hypothetical protein